MRSGYTLLELIAAVATLCVILALLFSSTGMATLAWKETAANTETFQQARRSFSTLTHRLSLATLNSYRDTFDTGARVFDSDVLTMDQAEFRYRSELHFFSGPAPVLLPSSTAKLLTHAVFFEAPLGYGSNGLLASRSLLNLCGYYVEFGDVRRRLPFLSAAPARVRHRLYEVIQPADKLALYANGNGIGSFWFSSFVANELEEDSHVLAENVVALVLLPQRRAGDTALAPKYAYDSRAWQTSTSSLADLTQNQLPPLVQVTMVVVDEAAAARAQTAGTLGSLIDASWFQDATRQEEDLRQLRAALEGRFRYRVFQSDVQLGASTWSETPP